jgi:predicted RNase H-like HicB family nuclease
MSEHTYTCLFEPDEDGGFVVTCPALPGLVTQGNTLEEARAMAAEAMELYLESVLADGERLPISEENVPGTIREPVTVMLPSATDADQLEDERELRDPEVQQLIEDGTKEYQAGNSRPAEDAARARAWEEILRTVDMPKWQGPGPEPSEEEVMQMVVEEIKRMRREDRGETG